VDFGVRPNRDRSDSRLTAQAAEAQLRGGQIADSRGGLTAGSPTPTLGQHQDD